MKKLNLFFLLLLSVIILSACGNAITYGTLLDESEPEKKLTLMVYMAADNDLEAYAVENLKQMEQASFNDVNVLVLFDRAEGYDETNGNWTDTRLFEVQHDSSNGIDIISKRLSCPSLGLSADNATELDMAKPMVLMNFIQFCKTNYKAEKYALIIWGHGTGWRAFAVDDRTDSYMSVQELGNSVRGKGLCVIGFDTCFGGVMENVYELKDCAEYTVASPCVTPSSGWNYKTLLEKLSSQNASSLNIAKAMNQSASSIKPTIFDNSKMESLMEAFEDFSKELSQSINSAQSRTEVYNALFSSKSYSHSTYPCDMFLDIYSMAALYKQSSNATLAGSAQTLQSAVEQISSEGSSKAISVLFIPLSGRNTVALSHSEDYVKDSSRSWQCKFIKESEWWVPTRERNSDSLLDKLFYKVY